jgi:hypothetical protein
MGLLLQLQALTVPEGTEFPGTVQELLDLIAQYEEITGGENFNGVNYGDTEPAPEDRDKAWFRTDGSGDPIGWYGWDGAAWTALPVISPSGTTAQRPSPPTEYQQFFDTDIDAALIYYGGQWRTLAGTPGDLKHVTGTTLASVLTKNPGWSHYTDGIGRVLAGAAADGSDAETDVGSDEVTLTVAELPAHTHEDLVVTGSQADNGDNGTFTIMAATESLGAKTVAGSQTGSKGDGDPFSIMQPTRFVFCLVKD